MLTATCRLQCVHHRLRDAAGGDGAVVGRDQRLEPFKKLKRQIFSQALGLLERIPVASQQ